jgi:hypothetical protein
LHEARKDLEASLALRKQLIGRSHSATLRLRARLGAIMEQLGEPQAALEHESQALNDCMVSGVAPAVCAELRASLTTRLEHLGHYRFASEHALSLMALDDESGERSYQFGPWNMTPMSTILASRGELESAYLLAKRGLQRLRNEASYFPVAEIIAQLALATSAREFGDLALAQSTLDDVAKALEKASEHRLVHLPEFHRQYGRLALAQGRAEQALRAFDEAQSAALDASFAPQEMAKPILDRAQAWLALSSPEQARYDLEQASALANLADAQDPAFAFQARMIAAEIALAERQWEEAHAMAEDALMLLDPSEVLDLRRAPAYFVQARAQVHIEPGHLGRKAARELAMLALQAHRTAGGRRQDMAAIEEWLARQSS